MVLILKPILAAALFATVLIGGFFYAAVNTLTDDPNLDW